MPETTPAQVKEAAAEALKASASAAPKRRNTVTKKTLQEALAETMGEVGYVQKDAVNDFHKYRYASAEAVLKKVNASLSRNGVCLRSEADLVKMEGPLAVVKLSLTFIKGSESVLVQGLGAGTDKGDKAVAKANTQALKYCLANAFLISWGDDPEADVETDKRASESAPKTNGKPKRASARAKGTAPARPGDDASWLASRIEGHESIEALRGDRKLVADLQAVGDPKQVTVLRRAWLRREAALAAEAPAEPGMVEDLDDGAPLSAREERA